MSYGTVQAEKMTTESGYSLGAGNASSFKNRIINGEMDIDQRNAGASITLTSGGGNGYPADRWYTENFTDGTATVQQVADAPAGFSNSIRYTVTATDASLASDQSAFIQQRVEGFNSADLSFGTASAKSITVSFWVKSSVTGTFGGALANNAYNRGYPFTYTISSANTWEQKSVTIPGDTTGTWVGATNGVGLRLTFALAAGSGRVSTAGAWASYIGIGATGGTNLMATNSATWQVTGVQLEVGTVATSFDFRSYGTELALCQRYYFPITLPRDTNVCYPAVVYDSTTILIQAFPVTLAMRTTPSITATRGTASMFFYRYDGTATINQVPTDFSVSVRSTNNGYWFELQWTGASSWGTARNNGTIALSSGTSSTMALSAEL